MLSQTQRFVKRIVDLVLGIMIVVWFSPAMIMIYIIGVFKFNGQPFFKTQRIGQYGNAFWLYKFRIYRHNNHLDVEDYKQLDLYAAFLHKTKLNELPQLIQVIQGKMSLVGPRPDVPGFADCLQGDERMVLQLKPGITGPASIKYKNETELLKMKDDPNAFNQDVIWPDKVKINLHYLNNWSLKMDFYYLLRTLF